MNKKVLFISYLFPPILNSGTYRSMKFVKYLPEFGWEPIVLTVDYPPDRPLEPVLLEEVPNNLKIIRVPMFSRSVANWIARICPLKYRIRFVEAIEWRLRRLWRIPDVHAAWKRSAVKAGLDIYKRFPFDVVFATGYPWTSFLVGKKISCLLNKPLVLDYRDPWTGGKLWKDSEKNRIFRDYFVEKVNCFLEKSVIKQARAVISTTDPFGKELRLFLSDNPKLKIYTITNGYDPEDFKKEQFSFDREAGKVYIVFVGVWKKGYGPEDLYEALKVLKEKNHSICSKLKVVCAGFPPGPAERYGISDLVQEVGFVPHKKAVGLMKSSDILYMIVPRGRVSKMNLPGKLFEYIGAEKPLLISSLQDSCSVNFIKGYEFALVANLNDVHDLINKLQIMVSNLDFFTHKARQARDLREKIDRRILTKKLSEIFNMLSSS